MYIENIRKALVQYDPANAAAYNRNAKTYAAKISALDALLRERLSRIPQAQCWLVSSEGTVSYLAKDYQLKEFYLWPINTDERGSPQQVRRVVDAVRIYNIPVVFSEAPFQTSQPSKWRMRLVPNTAACCMSIHCLSKTGQCLPISTCLGSP